MRFNSPEGAQMPLVDARPEHTPRAKVSALNVYPIKSCGGTELDTATLDRKGIQGDRSFMLTDTTGKFLTQRKHPRMALIQPDILSDGLLVVKAPEMPDLVVEPTRAGARREVTVWNDTMSAVEQGAEAREWFSDYLGTHAELVTMPPDTVRQVDPRYARDGDQVGFADGYPFLVISDASLADLNSRIAANDGEPVPMDRFRPNIVVSGTEPYAEDRWRTVRIGETVYEVVKPCERCAITTTDQQTAARGKEPLKTLATYRRSEKGGVMFGQNLVHSGAGSIRTGDSVEIMQKASEANFVAR